MYVILNKCTRREYRLTTSADGGEIGNSSEGPTSLNAGDLQGWPWTKLLLFHGPPEWHIPFHSQTHHSSVVMSIQTPLPNRNSCIRFPCLTISYALYRLLQPKSPQTKLCNFSPKYSLLPGVSPRMLIPWGHQAGLVVLALAPVTPQDSDLCCLLPVILQGSAA